MGDVLEFFNLSFGAPGNFADRRGGYTQCPCRRGRGDTMVVNQLAGEAGPHPGNRTPSAAGLQFLRVDIFFLTCLDDQLLNFPPTVVGGKMMFLPFFGLFKNALHEIAIPQYSSIAHLPVAMPAHRYHLGPATEGTDQAASHQLGPSPHRNAIFHKFAVITDGRPDGSAEATQHELTVLPVVFDLPGHDPMPAPGISFQGRKVVNELGT